MPPEIPPRHVEALEKIALAHRADTIERALEAAREELGMDVAYLSELTADEQVVRIVRGHGEQMGIVANASLPLKETFCQRMLAGEIPNAIPDSAGDAVTGELAISRRIGAYAGVPVQSSDGRVVGTLCCASAQPEPSLGEADIRFLRILARMVGDRLELIERSVP